MHADFLSAFEFNLTRKDDHADLLQMQTELEQFAHIDAIHTNDIVHMIETTRHRAQGKDERDLTYMLLCALNSVSPNLARTTLARIVNDPQFGSWRDIRGLCRYAKKGLDLNIRNQNLIDAALRLAHDKFSRDFSSNTHENNIAYCLPRSGSARDAWMFDRLAIMWAKERHPALARRIHASRPDILAKCRAIYRAAVASVVGTIEPTFIPPIESFPDFVCKNHNVIVMLDPAIQSQSGRQEKYAAELATYISSDDCSRIIVLDAQPRIVDHIDISTFVPVANRSDAVLEAMQMIAYCAEQSKFTFDDMSNLQLVIISDMKDLTTDWIKPAESFFEKLTFPQIILWNIGTNIIPAKHIPIHPNIVLASGNYRIK